MSTETTSRGTSFKLRRPDYDLADQLQSETAMPTLTDTIGAALEIMREAPKGLRNRIVHQRRQQAVETSRRGPKPASA